MSRYQAKLDGFDLVIQRDVRDNIDVNVPEYDIPFSTGAQLDNLGIKSRSVRVVSIWYNEKYEEHDAFIEHLKLPQDKTLVHPEYGLMKGQVKNIAILHNEKKQYVEVDFEFIENVDPDSKPAYEPDLVSSIENNVQSSQLKQMEQMADDIKKALGPMASTVLAIALDPDAGILSQLNGLTGAARSYIDSLDSALNVLDTALINIENPAESILTIVDYGNSLPGRVVGSISRTVERYSQALASVNDAPVDFINNLRANMSVLIGSVGPLKTQLQVAIAQIEPLAVSKILVSDEESRTILKRVENSSVWAADGTMNFKPEIPTVLSVYELEKTLVMIKQDIQVAITSLRNESGSPELIQALKAIAASMSGYINKIKIERDKIVDLELNNPMPLHLVCLQNDLPYMYAERICAINSFFNPTFCDGTIKIYVR